jgi:hypothetical protein
MIQMVRLAVVLQAGRSLLEQIGATEEFVLHLAGTLTRRFIARLMPLSQLSMSQAKEKLSQNKSNHHAETYKTLNILSEMTGIIRQLFR